ncbi:MAG: bifunctional DNA primase/polymerase [Actinobacteria bacterium]|nr:bifunctional DNA primase/polymerase [Actinomycetota bacterium]
MTAKPASGFEQMASSPSSPSSGAIDDLRRDDDDSNDGDRRRMKPSLSDAAAQLGRQGLEVFPLAPGTKVPRSGSAGFRDATTDAAQILEWWKAVPRANIGVRTTGLAIVDVDLYHPGSEESWDRLLDLTRSDSLLSTWVSRTGRGGRHLWYRLNDAEGRFLKNGYTSSLPIEGEIVHLAHLDMKSSGGSYVVAPPSVVPEGEYGWLRRGALAPAPNRTRGPKPQATRPAGTFSTARPFGSAKRVAAILDRIAAAPDGERNNTLNWGAFRMAEVVSAGVLRKQQAHSALLEAATEGGLESGEAERTINSAFAAQGL